MNIFGKTTLVGALGTALALGAMVTSAQSREHVKNVQTSTNWSIAIADHRVGLNPVNPVYVSPDETWVGRIKLSRDGEFKFFTDSVNGLVAHTMNCGDEEDYRVAARVTVAVAANGFARITCIE